MSLTTTDKNNSHQINAILQMAPSPQLGASSSSSSTSWLSEQAHTLQEGSPVKHIPNSPNATNVYAMDNLNHVATRLKVRDTLTTKVGRSLREQYLSLHRENARGVTVRSLHRSLQDHGSSVSTQEVAALAKAAGVGEVRGLRVNECEWLCE
jgi:hypothetical protein